MIVMMGVVVANGPKKSGERRGVRLSNAPAAMQLRPKTLPQCGTTCSQQSQESRQRGWFSLFTPLSLPATPAPSTHHILSVVGGWLAGWLWEAKRERKGGHQPLLPVEMCRAKAELQHQREDFKNKKELKKWEKVKQSGRESWWLRHCFHSRTLRGAGFTGRVGKGVEEDPRRWEDGAKSFPYWWRR